MPGAWNQAAAADDEPRAGDWLVGIHDESSRPLAPDDVKAGAKQLLALPYAPAEKRPRNGSRLNRILLIRPEVGNLDTETLARAADGVLAYSAICTPQACDVNAWREKEQALLCFCHFSQFQPATGGAVGAGPAPRPLPWLPRRVEDGRLGLAVHGKRAWLDDILPDGSRVEVLAPIQADAKADRRARVAADRRRRLSSAR